MKVTGISCAILAGGKNIRFGGRIKANAAIGGKKIIDRIIEVAENIFEEIILITSTPEEFSVYSQVKLCGDIFRDAGPAGGIHAALSNSETEAVFIVAGDMPFIDEKIIRDQIQFFLKTSAEAVVPRIEDKTEPLHGIYSKKIFPVLSSMLQKTKDIPVTDLLKKIRTEYFLLKPSARTHKAFFNVNTPEDLIRAEEISAYFDIE